MSTTTEDGIPELTLGWRLQMAMRYADLTALEMAQEMEVGRDTVGRWLHDDTVPHRFFLQAWAARTGVDYDWLVGNPNPKSARGTSEGAGRRPVTDNKDSQDKRRRPPRKRAETHSYRGFCHRYLTQETLRQLVDGREQCLVDHPAWVASSREVGGHD